jgi:hypothetical protein
MPSSFERFQGVVAGGGVLTNELSIITTSIKNENKTHPYKHPRHGVGRHIRSPQ